MNRMCLMLICQYIRSVLVFFCFLKIGQNEIIRFYSKVKENILHCVDSKTNILNKKYTIANIQYQSEKYSEHFE